MSYIVSARKYRPQTFEDVVGQDQITTTLKRSIESGHLAQAFLFCGPRGVGKTTCARIMAKAVNTGKTENLDQIDEDFSFNIFELDAASNNKVDDIHQLVAQVRIPPQTGKYKIYIIDEVHMLSSSAFNAFLKTLEEPPPYAIFILATTEKHKILPTILSRCQIYDFKRISVADITTHLKNIAKQENVDAEENALHIVAEKADGALRDALSIFDRLVSYSGSKLSYEDVVKSLNVLDYDYFFKITEHLLSSNLAEALLELDTIISNGFEGDQFMNGLSNHFRNLLVCKDERTIKLLELSDNLKGKYFAQSKLTPIQFLVNALSLASECDVNYAQSIQKRLLVETTLMKMAYLANAFDINEPNFDELAEKKKSRINSAAKETPVKKEEASVPEKADSHKEKEDVKKAETTELNDKSRPEIKKSKGDLSLADFEAEVEKELNKSTLSSTSADNDEMETETISGSLSFTEENVLKIWKNFLDKCKEDENPYYDLIDDKTPIVKDKQIIIIADSGVEKNLIDKDILQLTGWFNKSLNTKDYQLVIEITKDTKPKRVILRPKDIYAKMAQKNPLLEELRKNLDLELDI